MARLYKFLIINIVNLIAQYVNNKYFVFNIFFQIPQCINVKLMNIIIMSNQFITYVSYGEHIDLTFFLYLKANTIS